MFAAVPTTIPFQLPYRGKWLNYADYLQALSGLVAAWPLDDAAGASYARVVNPAVASGRNIVLNGGFDSDTLWTKGTGWTIAGGVAVATAAAANARLSPTTAILTINKAYAITFDVVVTTGSVKVEAGTGASGTTRSASGTYTETLLCTTTTALAFNPVSTFTGTIDNVSVVQLNIPASNAVPVQLLADGDMEAAGVGAWTAVASATLSKQTGTPHSGSQCLRIARNGVTTPCASQTILDTTKVQRVYGYCRSDGSAAPIVRHGATTIFTGTTSTAWQPFDVVFIPTATDISLGSTTNTGTQYVEFDDVTVSLDTGIRPGELVTNGSFSADTDWTKGTGWTIAGGVAHSDGTGTSATLAQTGVCAVGKTYLVTFTISNYVSGAVRVQAGSTGSGTTRSANGTYTEVLIAAGTSLVQMSTTTAFVGDIDNVSVTEVSPLVGKNLNGVLPGQASTGHGELAYSFDGTNDVVNIYSADLNSLFPSDEGSIIVEAQVSASGDWTDGTIRYVIRFSSNATVDLFILKSSTSNRITMTRRDSVASKTATISISSTEQIHIALTWSLSADELKAYINGAQSGSTITGLAAMSKENLNSGVVTIGGSNISGANPWRGQLKNVYFYNRALTAAEILTGYQLIA